MIQATNKMVDTRKRIDAPAYKFGNGSCPKCGGVLYQRPNSKGGNVKFCKSCPWKSGL